MVSDFDVVYLGQVVVQRVCWVIQVFVSQRCQGVHLTCSQLVNVSFVGMANHRHLVVSWAQFSGDESWKPC